MSTRPDLEGLFQRYRTHLHPRDDLSIVILKGHLLFEELLDRIITRFLPHGEFARQANLRFSQKLALAQGMCLSNHDAKMWDLIGALNRLRNDLAHQLESDKFDSKLDDVLSLHLEISVNDPDTGDIKTWSPEHQMHAAVVFILGFLDSFEKDVSGYALMRDRVLKWKGSL
jgi:hypothetical protein